MNFHRPNQNGKVHFPIIKIIMKSILVLATIVVAASALPNAQMVQQEFEIFKSENAKVYDNHIEEVKRMAIFYENLIEIEKHNKLYEQGLVTYKLGVTPFADMTAEEFLAYANCSRPKVRANSKKVVVSTNNLQESLDWRQRGVVTHVKHQGRCGSCWSFSATGAMEGQYALKHGKLVSLSEQQLVDCSGDYGNGGCNGGWQIGSFKYVKDHGIASEASYPYEAVTGNCRFNGESVLKVADYIEFQEGTSNLQAACSHYGPIAVSFHATKNFRLYKGGIFHDDLCNSYTWTHAVLLVGYGSNYWLVKNEWGSKWGEGGYFRISKNGTACGLTTDASVPIIAH